MSLTAAQRRLRRTGLTATDIVVLASGSDWHGRTIHDVWRSKVLGKDDVRDTEAMQIGSELEPLVLRRAANKLGLSLGSKKSQTIRHSNCPRYLATPDAIGVRASGEMSFLQAKVVGLHMARSWGDDDGSAEDLPESVFVQCAWEMFVGDVEVEYVGALLGTQVRTYTIHRSTDGVDDLVVGLRELGDRFWRDYVETKTPPPVDGSEGSARMLASIWPKPKRPAILAAGEAEHHARAYFEAAAALKDADQRRELAKQRLTELCGEHEGMRGDGWRLLLKWRPPCTMPAIERKGYRHFDCRPIKGQ